MEKIPICTATIFVVIKTRGNTAKLKEILKRFNVEYKLVKSSDNPSFDIEGHTLADIQEHLIVPLVEFLDPEKRSCFFHRSKDGLVSTCIVENGKVLCA